MARLHLIFGFLGSGKTTLVRHLLHTIDTEARTAVIVNEFGQMGFDGDAIVEGQNVDLVELSSGCICCTLKGSLLNAAEELARDAGAQRIIVEASGVADPEDMLDDFEAPEVASQFKIAPIITVADTANFAKLQSMLGEYYESQLANADILILNKIDLADRKTIEDTVAAVRELNPEAVLHYTEMSNIEAEKILLASEYGSVGFDSGRVLHEENKNHEHGHHHRHGSMQSFVVEPRHDIGKPELAEFCDSLPDRLFRMKGHMQIDGAASEVQYAAGQLDIRTCRSREHYRMIFIGKDLNPESIAANFGEIVISAD